MSPAGISNSSVCRVLAFDEKQRVGSGPNKRRPTGQTHMFWVVIGLLSVTATSGFCLVQDMDRAQKPRWLRIWPLLFLKITFKN